MPNDGHYSPLSDAGARSMKLRHFSPERGEGLRAERSGGAGVKEVENEEEEKIETTVRSQRVEGNQESG